jgi:hypothetical protein
MGLREGPRMLKQSMIAGLVITFAILALVIPASATLLPPGTPSFPGQAADPFLAPPSGALQGQIGPTAVANGTLGLTYMERVYLDGPNAACLAGGCLTFLIDVSNTGTDTINRITTKSFAGFLVDAGYLAIAAGATHPTTDDRSNDGSVIGFQNFSTPFATGLQTQTIVIQTNAKNFDRLGSLNFSNGATITAAALEPTAVPEPGSLLLLGAGLVGLVYSGARRRREGVGE